MKRLIWIGVAAVALQGCTGTIAPVGFPGITAADPTETCAALSGSSRIEKAKSRVGWYACALRNKARENYDQSVAWENRNDWRDLPLMAAAATVAGLLLFGERDAANALKSGEQDTISGIAFGSATFAAFADHLSPATARRLLRQSARGHFCLANQSEILLSIWDDAAGRTADYNALVTSLAILDAALASADPSLPNIADIRTVRNAGYAALELYRRQAQSLLSADVFLGESAWDFGLDLITQADRGPIDGVALSRSIVEQARNAAAFEQVDSATSTPVAAALVDAGEAQVSALNALNLQRGGSQKTVDTSVYTAAQTAAADKTRLLQGLVNVEALVLGFDACAATALTGGDPRAARVQRILPDS